MTAPLYALTDTWNNGATVFTAILMNVTDTASVASNYSSQTAGSLLLQLQAGTVDKFRVDKDGNVWFGIDGFAATTQNYLRFRNGDGSYPHRIGLLSSQTFGTALRVEAGAGSTGTSFELNYNTGEAIIGGASLAFASAFNTAPDIRIFRDAAQILAQRNGTNAQSFRVYNTFTDASNYERSALDWTTTSNVLTIGTQAAGTGTARTVAITAANGADVKIFTGNTERFRINNAGAAYFFADPVYASHYAFDPGSDKVSLYAVATSVLGLTTAATASTPDAWLNYAGQKRVTSDFSKTSSAALSDVTGLSVSVQAGRTYSFEACLQVTDAAAGGVQAAIAGTATATAIQYTGYTIADNAIKGKANATALGTAVGNTTTTETSGIIVMIHGTITVNAAGTLTVQMAQSVSNGTATIAKRGSYFIVQDMP